MRCEALRRPDEMGFYGPTLLLVEEDADSYVHQLVSQCHSPGIRHFHLPASVPFCCEAGRKRSGNRAGSLLPPLAASVEVAIAQPRSET